MRRLIPYLVLPLALIACGLANSPWLRAFPSSVIAVPLFGAALLSVLVPVLVVGIGVRRLWLTGLVELVVFVFYELLVTLREPTGFDSLWTGLVHGPSQILTFALPLVSPRTLLVAPVALCWLCGAIIGECVARGWQSVLPYGMQLIAFGLAYAGTARAISSSTDGRRYDVIMAGGLLLTLLLLRAVQTWVAQERGAEATQIDGRLPLRGLTIGTVAALVVALATAGIVQAGAFAGHATTPARQPPVNQSQPLTPDAFIESLRPSNPADAGAKLFTVTFNSPTSNYVSIATTDYYDGSGWGFGDRTFRPSGGVLPGEDDPTLRPSTPPVTQHYTIDAGPMTTAPWMPYLHRVEKVSGTAINIDPDSGMIVPAHRLTAGTSYDVESLSAQTLFSDLKSTDFASLSGDATDLQLPSDVRAQLAELITTLQEETGVPSSNPIPFLQAVARELQTKDALSSSVGGSGTPTGGAPTTAAPTTAAPTTSAPVRSTPAKTPVKPPARSTPTKTHSTGKAHGFVAPVVIAPRTTATRARTPAKPSVTPTTHAVAPTSPTPTPTTSAPSRDQTGGTGFADVLASIRQNHAATPEQYATLMALIARYLNVRARLASGFRIKTPNGSATLPQGTYTVTASEAWTWVEIPISRVGWVVLDPSPGTYSSQPNRSNSAQATTSPSNTPSDVVSISKPGDNSIGVAKPSKEKAPGTTSPWVIVLIVLAAIVVVLLALLLFLLLRKRLRARRRRAAGDPRLRLVGAWQEGLDVLVESGLHDLDSLTSAEVSNATAERFGGEPAAQARYLGDAANVAIFGPASWIGPAEADAAWQAQTVLRRTVRRRLGWRARIGASLRYHRPPRSGALVGVSSWEDEHRARIEEAVSGRRPGRRGGRRDGRGGGGSGGGGHRAKPRRAR